MSAVSPAEVVRRQASRTTHRIFSLPQLVLMPHSRCNCRCVMCDIWQANSEKRELTREDIERQLPALKALHVQRIVLSGGEALMHQNLWLLCDLLRSTNPSLQITLLSTGLLLNVFAKDIVRWCDEVIVSVDGTRATHDAIRRVPRAFDRMAEGIAALHAQKADYPVSARCVLHRTNFRDLPNIIQAAHEIGLQRISFMSADVSSTAFNRPEPWEEPRVSEVALTPAETHEFDEIVERVIADFEADFASHFISESPDKLRRLPRYYAALNGDGEFPETFCNAPWVSSVVEADGGVRPCFFHPAIGSIHDQTLEQVLNSSKAIEFRKSLDVKTNPICKACVCTLSLGRRTPA